MEFRQLFDKESSTYTYLIADSDSDSRDAVLIDPVLENIDRDRKLLEDLGLTLRYALDTHVHADHFSSLGKLRELTGCKIGLSTNSGAACADLKLGDGDHLSLGKLTIKVHETPGHTNGCLSYQIEDRVFTGDALLVRGCGRTDFQEGNPERLYESVTKKLFVLPGDTKIFPAHDYNGFTMTTIGEEKTLNPRLTKTKADFIAFMNNLHLPDPKLLKTAVPANLQCGKK